MPLPLLWESSWIDPGRDNGLLVTRGKLPPFIATLGTMKIFRSVTQHFMQGYTPVVPKDFLNIASYRIGGQLLMPILYWAAFALILHIVFTRTTFGRQVIAVGSNERATKLSGINVTKVKRWVYILMGSGQYCRSDPGLSYRFHGLRQRRICYEMDAISAVIVGGTSMMGGKGNIVGTIFGTLIIAVMNNLLNLLGVPPFLREAFKGIIVIGAVLLQKKDSNS
jgi:ribose transport system permease protein